MSNRLDSIFISTDIKRLREHFGFTVETKTVNRHNRPIARIQRCKVAGITLGQKPKKINTVAYGETELDALKKLITSLSSFEKIRVTDNKTGAERYYLPFKSHDL